MQTTPSSSGLPAEPKPVKYILGRMSPLSRKKLYGAAVSGTTSAAHLAPLPSRVQQQQQHIWENPQSEDQGLMPELDGILLALWAGTMSPPFADSNSGAHTDVHKEETLRAPPGYPTTRQNVALCMTMARLFSLPSYMVSWRPKLKKISGGGGTHTQSGPRHHHGFCYSLSNPMLGRECVHVPGGCFERAFCPCPLAHPPLVSHKPNAVGVAAGALGNYPLVKHLLNKKNINNNNGGGGGVGRGGSDSSSSSDVGGILVGACLMGELNLVLTFMSHLKEELFSNFEGVSAFHAAAASGNIRLIELLLQVGEELRLAQTENCSVEPDVADSIGEGEEDPVDEVLREAITRQQERTKRLVAMNSFREHCLHIALRCGHAKMSLFLLQEKCPPDAASLCRAIEDPGLHLVADQLLKQHADVRSISLLDSQKSPLAAACGILASGYTDKYAWLLLKAQSAHPNVGRVLGMTPIQLAVVARHYPLVKALAEAGADVNAQNDDGETVLHLAAKFWDDEENEEQAAPLNSGKKVENSSTTAILPVRRYYYVPPVSATAVASGISAQEEQRLYQEGKALTALTTLKYLVSRGANTTIANHAKSQRTRFLQAHGAGEEAVEDTKGEEEFTSWRLAKDIAMKKGRCKAFRALLE